MGISYRKVRDILEYIEPFSHEALRKWYSKLKVLFIHKKKHRRAIAVDETKVKLENQWIYIWNAIDVDNQEIIVIHVSTTRTSLDALYFMRRVLECCENEPLILVEQWYSLFKARIKRFWKGFPYHSSLESIRTGLWRGVLSIIYAGGEKLLTVSGA